MVSRFFPAAVLLCALARGAALARGGSDMDPAMRRSVAQAKKNLETSLRLNRHLSEMLAGDPQFSKAVDLTQMERLEAKIEQLDLLLLEDGADTQK
mmetsp:Transcript_105107/g.322218  ORF Transcript_105107/g.322218 Transcript_105107/m.322218 type:complete len:96 (-) Transcript_105107:58-345(-)|eukprot:CAMPEP_0198544550 /NCGR_PEP_ID=MMETSP1462-20131121/61208_1 /TAXON_ID=1333877 /ORGANISM="Brandtodinium nutriculum, Strain RCC3387" /LENGTH=95 /DNA_ID=CAMNT_0044274889 /DNA_START=79 /DNA_END=366 /DNA_ORIENTATION=-